MNADEAAECRRAMLRTAMGPAIAAALADPYVVEEMISPDGALRLDRLAPAADRRGGRRRTPSSRGW